MNYCPHCGHGLNAAANNASVEAVISKEKVAPARSKDALNSLLEKLKEVAPRFDDMSESEWGEWLNALEEAEFIEYIALGNEGIGNAIRTAIGEPN